MSRVVLSVSYTVPEQSVSEHNELIGRIRGCYAGTDINYLPCATQNGPGSFQELYIFPGEQSYEASDDIAEKIGADALFAQVEDLVQNMQFTVWRER
jgi:hypothetical protein